MYKPTSDNPAYFLTIKVNRNTPIFREEKYCNIITDSLKFCRDKYKFKLSDYVIILEHIHLIIYFNNLDIQPIKKERMGIRGEVSFVTNDILDDFITNFKKFTGKEILNILKKEQSDLLSMLILKKEKKRKHYYEFWQDGEYNFHIDNVHKLQEKQKYVHYNPVKHGLVKKIEDYKYCSYNNYFFNDDSVIKLDKIII